MAATHTHLPRDLVVICERAMHREPAARFVSADELAEELERWLRNEPIRSRPVPLMRRLAWWVHRRPALAALSAALVLALVCGYGLTEWQRRAAGKLSRDLLRQLSHVELARAAAWMEGGAVHQGLASLAATARRDPANPSVGIQLALQLSQQVWPRPHLIIAQDAGPFERMISTAVDDCLVTASADGWIQRWNLADGNPLGDPLYHGDGEWGSLLSHMNSKWTLSLKADGRLRVWSVSDGALALALGPGESDDSVVHEALFYPRHPMVLVASEGRPVRQIHLETGESREIPETHGTRVLAMDDDAIRLASSRGDAEVQLFNPFNFGPRGQLKVDGPTVSLAFGGVEKHLAVATSSNWVTVFNVKSLVEVFRRVNQGSMALAQLGDVMITEPALGNMGFASIPDNSRTAGRSRGSMPPWGIRLSKDRRQVLNVSAPGFLESVAISDKAIPGTQALPIPLATPTPSATYLRNPALVAVAGSTKGALVWRLDMHHLARAQFDLGTGIVGIGFSPSEDRLRILRRSGRLHEVRVTDLSTRVVQLPSIAEVQVAEFSSNGRFIATATTDGVAILEVPSEWSPHLVDQGTDGTGVKLQGEGGVRLHSKVHTRAPARALAFSPEGRMIAIAEPGRLQLWDIVGGRQIGEGITLDQAPEQTPGTATTGALYGLTRRRVSRSDAPNPDPVTSLPAVENQGFGIELSELGGHSMQFSPSGQYILLTAPGGHPFLIDTTRGEKLGAPALDAMSLGSVSAARWMPDGQHIVIARSYGELLVLDPFSSRPHNSIWMGHSSPILTIDVHPAGQFVATMTTDRMVGVWNVEKGTLVSSQQLNPFFMEARFHPGGNAIQCLAVRGAFPVDRPMDRTGANLSQKG